MRIRAWAIVSLLIICVSDTALCADLPGSKDPPFLKRYEGSEIVSYQLRSYDRYLLARGGADFPFAKVDTIEGQLIRLIYHVPGSHTSLELLRNYESALQDAGFTQTYELGNEGNKYQMLANPFYYRDISGGAAEWDSPLKGGDHIFYVTFNGSKDDKNITVAVLTEECRAASFPGPEGKNYEVEAGEVLVLVDVVTAKAVENKMVTVKAADMADALATKGSIDLYGIYFDVDKSDIKPDSTKTLDEIASLLKIDRSLKLEISGHTDNTGDSAHNMALSEARAKAVVDVLVQKYGIDAARLEAKGYGDTIPIASNDTEEGRAKNRRVELKKI